MIKIIAIVCNTKSQLAYYALFQPISCLCCPPKSIYFVINEFNGIVNLDVIALRIKRSDLQWTLLVDVYSGLMLQLFLLFRFAGTIQMCLVRSRFSFSTAFVNAISSILRDVNTYVHIPLLEFDMKCKSRNLCSLCGFTGPRIKRPFFSLSSRLYGDKTCSTCKSDTIDNPYNFRDRRSWN